MTRTTAPISASTVRTVVAVRAQLPVAIDRGPFGAVVAISADSDTPEHEVRRAYETLFRWTLRAVRAYSAQTCEAWRLDWKAFSRFCLSRGLQPLPAKPQTICAFITQRIAQGRRPATIARAISTIARAHRAAGVTDPCESEEVRLEKRAMYVQLGRRQEQARAFVWSEIERFLELPVLNLRDHRDRAFIAAAYDSMCRSEELVAFNREHIDWLPDGSGVAFIKDAKNDPEGEGAFGYFSPLTVKLLKRWLTAAGIESGAIFRVVDGNRTLGPRLEPEALGERIRRAGQWIGLPLAECQELSGHSCRVGATQDLLALDLGLPAVMQAGRWKDPRMVLRYGEKVLAARGAMARAAKMQGRL